MDAPRSVPRRLHGDEGYTLTELLATIAIMAVILPTIVMALVLALRATSDASNRFDEAFDSELLMTYFVPDAQSANVIGGNVLDTPCDSLERPEDLIRLVGLRFATGYRRVDLDPDTAEEYALERWTADLTDTNDDGLAECVGSRTHIVAEHIENVTAFSDTENQVALRISTTSGRDYSVSASQRTGTIDLNSRPTIAAMVVNCHNLTCDGTGSWSDPDGTIASAVWDWGDGTPSGPDPHHVYAAPGGTFTVRLTVTDDSGAEATATQQVVVESNLPPAAGGESYTINEDTTLIVDAPGVLGNDTDPGDDPLIAELVDDVDNGTLTLLPDGSFTYQPDLDTNGVDSFQYRATDIDGASSAPVTVTITVLATNDPPAAADDTYETQEDVQLVVGAPGVLGNDVDVEGEPIAAVFVAGPSHGSVSLDADGSFNYDPDSNYNGPDSFTYRATDGTEASNVTTVHITVRKDNDGVPSSAGESYTTAEDTAITVAAPGVLGNDTDVDGDTLSTVLVTDVAHGDLALNANGGFTYAPDANYVGPDSFEYQANDGTGVGNTATVSLTVTPLNDAPIGTSESYSVYEDEVLTDAAPGVLGNDTDVEGAPLTASLVTNVAHGVLVFGSDGSFTYTPTPNYFGQDSFVYRASDGTAQSQPVTVNITVLGNPVNDGPDANNDGPYSTNEDTSRTVAAPGVLANDTDVDGDPLAAVNASSPAHGTVVLNPNGSFTYTPSANYNGPDSFTYQARDPSGDVGSATVSIIVTPVDDRPTGVADSFTMSEDGVLNISAPGVLANDSDVDGDSLTAVFDLSSESTGVLSNTNANGSFRYTPPTNFTGTATFTYQPRASSVNGNVTTVTITVTPSNDPPNASNNTYSAAEDTQLTVNAPGVLGNDTDPDGDALTAVNARSIVGGTVTLNANGGFVFQPTANFSGPGGFTYDARDPSGALDAATVTINVAGANDAPTPHVVLICYELHCEGDAGGWSDPDGVTTYQWDWDYNGTFGSNTTGVTSSFNGYSDSDNNEVIALRVTDALGNQTTITRNVYVSDNSDRELGENGAGTDGTGRWANLTWSTSDFRDSSVLIYRCAGLAPGCSDNQVTTTDDGGQLISWNPGPLPTTVTYRLCEPRSSPRCSNEVVVVFE